MNGVLELREAIINKILINPKLGVNYIDYHTDNGECGLELIFGEEKFDLIITKKEK